MSLLGCATTAGTIAFRNRHRNAADAGFFRQHRGLWLSSLGIGTYLGDPGPVVDARYCDAVKHALVSGVNVIDTAINYRFQRSERAIGAALQALDEQDAIRREELLICTKAGFLTPDGEMPANPGEYFENTYLTPGAYSRDDVVQGMHVMTPTYLADQLDRSLINMGLDCVDVFYVHNPETQLAALPGSEFVRRLRLAFEMLEQKVIEGKIQWYGTATWTGYRAKPATRGALALEEVAAIARQIAGNAHHFRFVQLPYNLAMPEAFTDANQPLRGRMATLLDAARELDITVIASGSLMQGQLAGTLPDVIAESMPGLQTSAQRAIQFTRSTPGIAAALVGMSDIAHVGENLALTTIPPASEEQLMKLFTRT